MLTLYVSQQGCYLTLEGENLLIKKGKEVLSEAQIPLLEQVLIFGQSQVTTQAIRACLTRNVPIAYLSRMGYCYGRILPVERGYRHLSRYQQQLTRVDRLIVARRMVKAKLKNSRTILQRQARRHSSETINFDIQSLNQLMENVIIA